MGFYVNPPNETKETFLRKNGKLSSDNLKWEEVPEGHLPVVLIDNGLFTAAGIAYCEKELREFTDPTDERPRQVFLVETEKLYPTCYALKGFLEKEK